MPTPELDTFIKSEQGTAATRTLAVLLHNPDGQRGFTEIVARLPERARGNLVLSVLNGVQDANDFDGWVRKLDNDRLARLIISAVSFGRARLPLAKLKLAVGYPDPAK